MLILLILVGATLTFFGLMLLALQGMGLVLGGIVVLVILAALLAPRGR